MLPARRSRTAINDDSRWRYSKTHRDVVGALIWRCRRPNFVTYGNALSTLWRWARRDVRRPKVFEVTVASAVKWLQRRREEKRPKPRWKHFAVGRVRC
jgi:hypothetical protein